MLAIKEIRLVMFLLLAASLPLIFGTVLQAQTHGNFQGKFVVEWLEDGRNMRLLNDVSYTDPRGRTWIAPKGTVTDGATIPESLWTIIGSPFGGKYRNAAVIHDHYCVSQDRAWRDTHKAFYEASLAAGVEETTADIMYFAVYRFGPRWGKSRAAEDDSSKIVFKPKVVRGEFLAMKTKIENRSVKIEDIEKTSDRQLRSLSRSFIE